MKVLLDETGKFAGYEGEPEEIVKFIGLFSILGEVLEKRQKMKNVTIDEDKLLKELQDRQAEKKKKE